VSLEGLEEAVLLQLVQEQQVGLVLLIKDLQVELVIQITPILGLVAAVEEQEPLVLTLLALLHLAEVLAVLVL
tara:strand:- start:205 stop:423 length:219 start_codon:yes stop_codon:yes gene_type:complete